MTRQALAATKQRKKKKKRGKRSTITTTTDSPQCSPKEQQFVDEYLVDLNGRRAYQVVYPDSQADSAAVGASRLLIKANISAAIALRREELSKQVQVTQAEIVREFRRVGMSANADDYLSFSKDGVSLKDSAELTRDQMGMISEISHTRSEYGTNIRFKLHDKLDALNALAKHLGMFPTRVEQPPVQVPVQFIININPTDKNEGESRRRVVKDVPARQIDHCGAKR